MKQNASYLKTNKKGRIILNNFTIIAAIGQNNELGKNNTLIWKLKKDMNFFKENTLGKKVVMGRKTFNSLPHPLKNRTNIILTSKDIKREDIIIIHSKEELYSYLKDNKEEIMIIGGSSIYRQFIEEANKLLLTEIKESDNNADTYFPIFNKKEWNKIILKEDTENNIEYKHVEYTRKRKKL